MNPDTNELVRVDNRKLKNILRRGFIPIPKKLHKAADLALGKKRFCYYQQDFWWKIVEVGG